MPGFFRFQAYTARTLLTGTCPILRLMFLHKRVHKALCWLLKPAKTQPEDSCYEVGSSQTQSLRRQSQFSSRQNCEKQIPYYSWITLSKVDFILTAAFHFFNIIPIIAGKSWWMERLSQLWLQLTSLWSRM